LKFLFTSNKILFLFDSHKILERFVEVHKNLNINNSHITEGSYGEFEE